MNAKEELIKAIKKVLSPVQCAYIQVNSGVSSSLRSDKESNHLSLFLKVNFTSAEFELFLRKLNVDYSNNFGISTLIGTVWFEDGSWLERYHHYGLGTWVHKEYPLIPDWLR